MKNDTNISPKLCIWPTSDKQFLSAQKIAEQLGLPVVDNLNDINIDWYLKISDHGIALGKNYSSDKPLLLDFTNNNFLQRLKSIGKQSPLARAIGLNKISGLHVCDALLGLGRDAIQLSYLTAKVTAIEASPVIYTLVNDAIKRLTEKHDNEEYNWQHNWHSIETYQANSEKWLADAINKANDNAIFDAVYLDPMFPIRQKKAKVKKDMQYVQQWSFKSNENDDNKLFEQAIKAAKHRVVIKRPKGSSHWLNKKADFSIDAGYIRFDIYQNKAY